MADYLKKLLHNWEFATIDFLPRIVLAILIVLAFFFLGKLGKRITQRLTSHTMRTHSDLPVFLGALVYFFLLISGVFIALEVLGLEAVLTRLLAGAGIIGIIAGFAFKDIASNAFSGLLLNMQKPIKTGDWVEMDGAYGTVLKISWLTTIVKNTNGQQVFVPNQIIYSNTFSNYSTFGKRKVVLRGSVANSNSLDQVREIAISELQKLEQLLAGEPIAFAYTAIGNACFDFEASFWIRFEQDEDFLLSRSDAIVRLQQRFEKEGIALQSA